MSWYLIYTVDTRGEKVSLAEPVLVLEQGEVFMTLVAGVPRRFRVDDDGIPQSEPVNE